MTNGKKDLRETALDILLKYEKSGEKLNSVIQDVFLTGDYPDKKDRAFIKILSEGTVERRITLDYVIDRFSNVETGRMKPLIRNLLRMGAYQLLFMDTVPPHAVCSESVRLVKKRHMSGLSGFVNAVLRRIAGEGFDVESIKEPHIKYSCPEWIFKKLRDEYGADKAVDIIRSFVERQPVYIRTNITRIKPDELEKRLREKGLELSKVGNRPYAFSISGFGDLSSLAEFEEGFFSVQDISSMSIGDEIREILYKDRPESFRILDLCAAPGGKSCHSAEILTAYRSERKERSLFPGRDAFFVESRDISETKRLLIEENRERLGLDLIKTAVLDASDTDIPDEDRESYDLVIADLPCSGLGVTGRKNDLKYRVQPEDIPALKKLQRDILINADCFLKRGGCLIFSVCTVTREETEEQDSWIRESFGYHRIKEKLILPGEGEGDGFYYAVYIKDGTVYCHSERSEESFMTAWKDPSG